MIGQETERQQVTDKRSDALPRLILHDQGSGHLVGQPGVTRQRQQRVRFQTLTSQPHAENLLANLNGGSFWRVFGAVDGVILDLPLVITWTVLPVTVISYIIADEVDPTSDFGQFMRGLLIGMNAGLNGPLGLVIGFLSAFDGVAKNKVYQIILGWSNLLLPMSWPVDGVGVLFFLVNGIGHLIGHGIFGSNFWQIKSLDLDAGTGTLFTEGGLVGNLAKSNGQPTAFDMGNFAFVNSGTLGRPVSVIKEHETGHTLNLGAFGSIVHFIGAIDENITGGGASAYTEQLAESHVPVAHEPISNPPPRISMWT
jgi:hypothetical protein